MQQLNYVTYTIEDSRLEPYSLCFKNLSAHVELRRCTKGYIMKLKLDHFLYIQSGSLDIKKSHRSNHCGHNTCWFLTAGDYLILDRGAKAMFSLLVISNPLLTNLFDKYPFLTTSTQSTNSLSTHRVWTISDPFAIRVMESLWYYFNSDHSMCKRLLPLKLEELLLAMASSEGYIPIINHFKGRLDGTRMKLFKVMEQHFKESLLIEEYAQICGMSLATFKRNFTYYFGMSPGRWLTDRRLVHAQSLLLSSNLNINEVAMASGFESASHFIHLFKRKYLKTPLHYRQLRRRSPQCSEEALELQKNR